MWYSVPHYIYNEICDHPQANEVAKFVTMHACTQCMKIGNFFTLSPTCELQVCSYGEALKMGMMLT